MWAWELLKKPALIPGLISMWMDATSKAEDSV